MSRASKVFIAVVFALVVTSGARAAESGACEFGCGTGDLVCVPYWVDDASFSASTCAAPWDGNGGVFACSLGRFTSVPLNVDYYPASLSVKLLEGLAEATNEDCEAEVIWGDRGDSSAGNQYTTTMPMGFEADADAPGTGVATAIADADRIDIRTEAVIEGGGIFGIKLNPYDTHTCTTFEAGWFNLCFRAQPNSN